MVICLERCSDLQMAQLMPLPLTVSCFSKIQIVLVLPFWYRPTRVVLEKGPLNGCVCVFLVPAIKRVYVCVYQHTHGEMPGVHYSPGARFTKYLTTCHKIIFSLS